MPAPDPVTGDTTLPERVDTVVIGGGIIGTVTALELAEAGQSVALFEKGVVAGEQSGRNWGWCRQTGRDPREIPLIVESLKRWRDMSRRVEADTGFRQCGIAYLCADEAELAARTHWWSEYAQPFGLATRRLGAAEAQALAQGSTVAWTGGLHTTEDGRAEPQQAAPAIARAAQRAGARVFTGCAVRTLERAGGAISGVVTERGPLACSAVVLAAGSWSRRMLHNEGVPLAQLTVRNSVMRTAPLAGAPETTLSGARFAFRKRADGGYTIAHRTLSVADLIPDSLRLAFRFLPALRGDWSGLRLRLGRRFVEEARLARRWTGDQTSPFERVRVLDPPPAAGILREAAQSLARVFPAFAAMQVVERWAGIIDVTPDAVPVIDTVPALPGLVVATGFSGHGFGLGPGAGRLAADLALGRPPIVDPAPFNYRRMIDGTRLAPTPGI